VQVEKSNYKINRTKWDKPDEAGIIAGTCRKEII